MGMAASQARLLTLTARKSDLEFRAQQITNSEMILAMQTEVAAKEYSNAMSNTKYQVNTYTNDAEKKTIWADMTAEQLFGVMGYGMRSDDGEKITLDNYEELLANGDSMAQKISQAGLVVTNGGELAWTQSTTVTEFFLTTVGGGLLNADGADTSLAGDENITTTYDTSDDAAAQAKYDQKMARIEVKEKQLQIDLEQIKNQQKACDTEIDSIQKIIDKSIERSFKVFS